MPITSPLLDLPKFILQRALYQWMHRQDDYHYQKLHGSLATMATSYTSTVGHATIMEVQVIHRGMQNSELHIRYVIRTEKIKRTIKFRTVRQ